MKRFSSYVLVILLLNSTCFVSCSKTGEQGPQGPAGPAGAVGPAGKDGSQIYAGPGAPSASLGNAGDYYLDQTADNLYGPKTASGWGSPLALKGATGAAGAAGSKILSGSGTPASNIGSAGDYYLDVSSYLLYGPKTTSGWGGGLMLKGKDGNQFVNTFLFRNQTIALSALSQGGMIGSADLHVPAITTGIMSTGAVLAYTDYGTYYGAWYALPIVNPNSLYLTTQRIEPGDIELSVYFPVSNISSITADFEVVVIQGATVTQLNAANPNVNFNDYNQVASLFHLDK
ncbi:MAG: collagen-like protein [Bacteroidetes bacterium]|nr:collagen-like protein [Bacteroidota bacterium]